MVSGGDFGPFRPVLVGGGGGDGGGGGVVTRVGACGGGTPDRSSSVFAGFSGPRASAGRGDGGRGLHLYFGRGSPVRPVLSMGGSGCGFGRGAIWWLAPEGRCGGGAVAARGGWTPVAGFGFHAGGTPGGPEMCIIMQY